MLFPVIILYIFHDCFLQSILQGLGIFVGTVEGMKDGPSLGNNEGLSEDCFAGILVGTVDGVRDGPSLGNGEGESDDEIVGVSLGNSEGYSEGLLDG